MKVWNHLLRRIEATDREIDRLVYELYSLTDEEIRLVEEATGWSGERGVKVGELELDGQRRRRFTSKPRVAQRTSPRRVPSDLGTR